MPKFGYTVKSLNKKHEQRGFVLVEVMVAAAILAAILVAMASMLLSDRVQSTATAVRVVFGAIQRQMIDAVFDPNALIYSARDTTIPAGTLQASRDDLATCVDVTNPGTCTQTAGTCTFLSGGREFYLIPIGGSIATALGGSVSSASQQITYDVQGRRCPVGTNSSSCPIKVSTCYQAICLDGSGSCTKANVVRVAYKIEYLVFAGNENRGKPKEIVSNSLISLNVF